MAIKVKIDPLAIDIPAMLSGGTLADQKKTAADFARKGIADADQINQRIFGRVPPHTITVDGTQGAALETVNPDGGSIIVEYDLIGDVLIWIAKTLEDRSPIVSGAYKRGHTLYADGVPTDVNGTVPQADVYTFINTVPYARKLEVGKTEKGRAFLVQVPNRIYERTANDARRKFHNSADIQFGYAEAVNAYRLKNNQAARHFLNGGRVYIEPSQRKDRAAGSAVSSPAIIVKLRKS